MGKRSARARLYQALELAQAAPRAFQSIRCGALTSLITPMKFQGPGVRAQYKLGLAFEVRNEHKEIRLGGFPHRGPPGVPLYRCEGIHPPRGQNLTIPVRPLLPNSLPRIRVLERWLSFPSAVASKAVVESERVAISVSLLARPERLELPTLGFEDRYSIQLSYGRALQPAGQGIARSAGALEARRQRIFGLSSRPDDS